MASASIYNQGGREAESAEHRGVWGEVRRDPGTDLQESWPPEVVIKDKRNSSSEKSYHAGNSVHQGSSVDTRHLGFYLELVT